MDDGRKQALRVHHQELKSGLILKNILPAFRIYLTDVEYSQVEGKQGNVAQIDTLIRILLTKENRHFDGLTSICEHNGYPHWAKKLWTTAVVRCMEKKRKSTSVAAMTIDSSWYDCVYQQHSSATYVGIMGVVCMLQYKREGVICAFVQHSQWHATHGDVHMWTLYLTCRCMFTLAHKHTNHMA